MAGQNLSSKATEVVEFLDYVIVQCGHLAPEVLERPGRLRAVPVRGQPADIGDGAAAHEAVAAQPQLGVIESELPGLGIA